MSKKVKNNMPINNSKSLKANSQLAAFDVDGTLTYCDSFMLFLRFCTSRTGFILRILRLVPVFAAYLVRIISRDEAKTAILTAFFKGMKAEAYQAKAREFGEKIYAKILRLDAIMVIEFHKSKEHEIALVSASLEDYLMPLAKTLGAKTVLASRMEIIDGRLSGKMLGPNCRAQEKLNRIYDYFGQIEICDAYGDSNGDTQMLLAAINPHYRELIEAPANRFWSVLRLYFGDGLKI